ncbi:hypothetical protein FHR32_006644 [Streptosporangium album]|uniref:Uncharacterized protein n=1 Tax=Streptosporangium album TaxID=47479 RepID=A0A7W7S1L4_9ACTN|nr:hypothetical protein [Streptosporangium album]MBB4942258.1 hypothetical protein [Streptosporangium album]
MIVVGVVGAQRRSEVVVGAGGSPGGAVVIEFAFAEPTYVTPTCTPSTSGSRPSPSRPGAWSSELWTQVRP